MATGENTPNLPTDIVPIILSNLPVKSLIRVKTVSKSWNAMISDPQFVQTHLHQSKHSNTQDLFLSSSGSRRFVLFKLEGRKFQTEAKLANPYTNRKVLCFCDGVVLLFNYVRGAYVLWNPCNRSKTMLRCPYRFNDYRMNYGLCHYPTMDDFKVVIVSRKYYVIFSCKNNSWTKRGHSFCITGTIINNPGVCVNGAVYWVWRDTYNAYIKEIIYFDPRDEELKILQKPKDVKGADDFSLICLKGSLCLYRTKEGRIDFWIKEEGFDDNSWLELMIIETSEMGIEMFKPLCFVENKILMRLGRSSTFAVYSPCEKTFEAFEESNVFGVTLVPCVDSLFFPVHNTRTRPKRKRNAFIANQVFKQCIFSRINQPYWR